jgi:hypothetical protein
MPGRAARRREPSHAISPHRPATRHAEALLAADTHWIDLSRRVSRSPLVMHPEPGGRTPRSEHEIRAVLRGLGPAARGVGRCEAGKPVEAQLLYVSSVSGCGPGRLPDECSRHRASAAGSTSRALWRARPVLVIPVGVDERRHVVHDQESRDHRLAEVQESGVLAMGTVTPLFLTSTVSWPRTTTRSPLP